MVDALLDSADADQEIARLLLQGAVEISREDALKVEPYANAVSILSSAIAQQDIQITEPHETLVGNQYRQIVEANPLYSILENPFTYCTKTRMFKQIARELLLENQCFVQVTGEKLRVASHKEFHVKDNKIISRQTQKVTRMDIIPILLDEPPSYCGVSESLRLWGLLMGQRTTFFKGDVKSGTLITFKGTESSNITEDLLLEMAGQLAQSVKDKSVTVAPEIEAAIHKLNNDPDAALFDATTEIVLRAIARQFGISASRLGDVKSTKVTTDVKAAEVSLRASLRPYSTVIEEAFTRHFFPKQNLKMSFVKGDDDPKESINVEKEMILNGLATIDELRSLHYNLPPLPNGVGAEPILPGQQIIKDHRDNPGAPQDGDDTSGNQPKEGDNGTDTEPQN